MFLVNLTAIIDLSKLSVPLVSKTTCSFIKKGDAYLI